VSDLSGASRHRTTWREWAGVTLTATLLTVVMTHPTVTQLSSVGRLGTGDGRFSIWNVAWVSHILSTSPFDLFNANIFHPASGVLAYSELNLIAGVLGLPFYLATESPLAALNGAIILGTLLSFFCMWALVRRLSGSSLAGVLAAITFTFSPYVSARTPHIQLYLVFVFPLVLLAFVRLVDRPTIPRGAALGAALAVAALTCGYYGLTLVLVLAGLVAWWATRDLAYWRALVAGAIVTAALVLPILVPYLAIRGEAGAGTRGRSPEASRTYSASWRDYLTSGTQVHALWSEKFAATRPANQPVEVLFPGIVVLVVGVAGLGIAMRSGGSTRRWAIGSAAVVFLGAWASFGPDAGLYRVLMQLPGMDLLRAPGRFGILVPFGLAITAGYAVAHWARGRAWIAIALMLVAAVELKSRWPLDQMPALPEAYRMLAQLPRGPVIEYPFPYRRPDFHNHTKAMLPSSFHWQPLVNGYSDFTPAGFEAFAAPANAFPDLASFALLRAKGVRYVVWRAGEYNAQARATLEARFPPFAEHLRLLTRDADVWLYEIVSWPEGTAP
jgi:hypothetical protein